MNAFDEDVRERKRLVSSARHKKNGSKSKRCSLPSDHLTQKQWKERCGKVMEYKLGRPVPWAEFKMYPKDVQELYIQDMVEKYHVTASDLGRLFGCHYATVSKFCKQQGLRVPFSVGRRMSSEEKAAFQKLFTETGTEEPPQETPQDQEENGSEEVAGGAPSMSLRSFSFSFDGPYDPVMVLNSLSSVLQEGDSVSIRIDCDILPQESDEAKDD